MYFSPQVERWRPLVEAEFARAGLPKALNGVNLIDKAMYVIQGESGGNPTISGDGGLAYGLVQSHYIGHDSTPEQQVAEMAQMVAKNPAQWTDWGEGVTYEGKPFGALGQNNPYPGQGGNMAGQTASFDPYIDRSPEWRNNILGANGYTWKSGNGKDAIWSYKGNDIREEDALKRVISNINPAAPPPPSQDGTYVGEEKNGFTWNGYEWIQTAAAKQTPSQIALQGAQAAEAQARADLSKALLAGTVVPLPGTTAGEPGKYMIAGTGQTFDSRTPGQYKPIDGMPGYFVDPVSGHVVDNNNNTIAKANLDFLQNKFNTEFPEQVRQYNNTLAENARQFDAAQALKERAQAAQERQTARGQSLNEAQFQAEILRNPADFLARAFFQRGGTSPLPQVTQKDLLNLVGKQTPTSLGPTGAPTGQTGQPVLGPSAPPAGTTPTLGPNGKPLPPGVPGTPEFASRYATTLDELAAGKPVAPGGMSVGVGAGGFDKALADRLVAEGKLVQTGTLNGSTQYVTPAQAAQQRATLGVLGGQGLAVTPPVPGPAGAPPVTTSNPSGFQPVFGGGQGGVLGASGVIPNASLAAFNPPASSYGAENTGNFNPNSPGGGTGAALGTFGFDNASLGLGPSAFGSRPPAVSVSTAPNTLTTAPAAAVASLPIATTPFVSVPPANEPNQDYVPDFVLGSPHDYVPGQDRTDFSFAEHGGNFPAGTKVITGEKGPELVRSLGPIEVIPLKTKKAKKQSKGAPKAALGGIFGDMNGFDPAAAARQFQPPAVASVLGGQMPNQMQFQFALPSQQMLGALTPDEQQALNTSLAAQYNTTLGDVNYESQRRFGALGPAREARRVA